VHLSVHAHKHGFNRLIWLKDLDMLIPNRRTELDWHDALEIARAEGVTASVWFALQLSQFLLGTPVPADWLQQTRPSAPLRAIYCCVWPTRHIAALDGHMRRRAIQFHVADSWRGMLPSLILMGQRRTPAVRSSTPCCPVASTYVAVALSLAGAGWRTGRGGGRGAGG
jgi:hypothetical protein